MVSKKKVCVVGAGISGLISARELRREGRDVTVLEQNADVGGQCLYDPRTDAGDPLRAAAPVKVAASMRPSGSSSRGELMSFSDFPFYPSEHGGDARRYLGHPEVLRYLRDFCDEFGLMDAVRLNTKVLRVAMAPPSRGRDHGGNGGGRLEWVVRSEHDKAATEEVFDAVVVATGHYSQPRVPTIAGMEEWSRRQLHSHSDRVPDSFQDEVVVIVGCHESGKDIALELCDVAKEVHISVKSIDDDEVVAGMSMAISNHGNLHMHLRIECLCPRGLAVSGMTSGEDS